MKGKETTGVKQSEGEKGSKRDNVGAKMVKNEGKPKVGSPDTKAIVISEKDRWQTTANKSRL